MGSPFDKFRKHQKRLLVFLGVVCMVAFVFAGVQCSGPGMATTQPYLEVEGEVFTQGDVNRWLNDRRLAERVAGLIREKGGRRFGFGRATEEEVITLMLLVRLGKELGIRVSDAQINHFLSESSQGKVTADDILAVLQEYSATEADLFRAIRRELIAAQVMTLYVPPGNNPSLPSAALASEVDRIAGGLSRTSPSQLWDIFLKLNRLADIEAIPFRVEESLGAVGTPDEQTLRKFFEEHKERLPDPDSPTPGFRRPHRVKLRWIQLPYQRIFEEMLAEVTEEEIQQYYEKNKEQFRYTGFSTEPPQAQLPLVAPDPRPRGEQKPEEKRPAPSRPSNDSQKAKPAPVKKENSDKQSRLRPSRSQQLVQQAAAVVAGPLAWTLLQQEDAPGTKPQEPIAEQAQPPPSSGASGQNPAASNASGGQEESTSLSLLATELQVPDDIRTGPAPKYDPLWKVQEQIRRLLARQKANDRMIQIARELMEPLLRFSQRWTRWDASGRKGPEPQMPDLSGLLRRYQLKLEGTPLVDARQLFDEYALGKAYLGQPHPQFGWQASQPVLGIVFDHLGLFQVEQARDQDNNHYIFWKEEDRPSYVPSLEEARQEVVRAWKLDRAREITQLGARSNLKNLREDEEANLQEEARVSGKPYIHPQPFSWWDPASLGFDYAVSEIPEIGKVDEEFMKTVFSLQPGELALVSNRQQTVFYVVRLLGFEYRGGLSEEQVRRTFRSQMGLILSNSPLVARSSTMRFPYVVAAQQEYAQSLRAWQTYLFERYRVRRIEAETGGSPNDRTPPGH